MFKKLISNLPFNPSLLGQVSFYAKRLKQEQSIRRLGFGFMALAFLVQVFAVIAPPQKSLAQSSPDYIVNNLTTRQDILRAWDNGSGDQNVAEIYGKFGLTRDDIAALPLNPNMNASAHNQLDSAAADYWTIGRQSLSGVTKAGQIKQQYKDSEIPVNTGSTTVYIRNLKAWDIINSHNLYNAWSGTKNGKTFYILQDCGNLTTVGIPPTNVPPSPPAMTFRKTIDGGPRAINPGDQFTYRFEYENNVPNSSNAQGVTITDTLDLAHFDVVSIAGNATLSGSTLTFNVGEVPYSNGNFQLAGTVTVKAKGSLANGTGICNTATLTGSNVTTVTSGGAGLCMNIINPCTLDSSVPSATDSDCSSPTLVCSITQADINRTTKESTLTTKVTTNNAKLTHVVSYAYDFGDKTNKTNNSTALTDTVKHVYKDGNYSATVVVLYTIGSDTKTTHSVGCAADVETKPDQPLTPSKTAQNITQKLGEADTIKTKANGGDVIEYALNIHNSFNYDRGNYTISDYIGDTLDYATLDTTFLTQQGGSYDSAAKTVNWDAQTVKGNSDMVKKFRVTIKNPVPATNVPGGMTTSYDCVISNKFGDQVNIPINCPPAKTAEYIATALPNTGPGTSIFIGAAIMIIVGYFFARSRLLGKELELVRAEYSTGGGF